jgi:hypothetical protein
MAVVAVVALLLLAWREWLAPRFATVVITSRKEIVTRPSLTFNLRDPKQAAAFRTVQRRLDDRGVGYRIE